MNQKTIILVGLVVVVITIVGGYFVLNRNISDMQHRDNYLNCIKPCIPTYEPSPNAGLDIKAAECGLKCQNDFKLGACINSCEEGNFGDRPISECIQQVWYPNYK